MNQPTDPVADTVDGPPDADLAEDPLRADLTRRWMAYLGYEPEQIAAAEADPVHTDECEFHPGDYGWVCQGENGEDLHPDHHELCRTAEMVNEMLEWLEGVHGWGDVSDLRAQVAALTAERDEAVAKLAELKNQRILSVVFGHHPGAPRPFALRRREDVSGVSGTGIVALGAEWPDGLVVLRWTSDWPTSVVFHDRGIESVEAIHGHGGKTEVVWLSDELEPLAEMEQERDQARAELAERTRERYALRLENASLAGQLLDVQRDCQAAVREQGRTREVVEKAIAWKARIVDPPYLWADEEDAALIAAVERYQHPTAADSPEPWTHDYDSTSCQHARNDPDLTDDQRAALHQRCATSAPTFDGYKQGSQCKHCAPGAGRCVCPCHTAPAMAEPVAHELEIVPRPKMDSDGLVAARCSCGKYESNPGTEATVTKDWRQHAAAKTAAAVVSGFVERARARAAQERPRATGGIVEPGMWLIGESRDVPSLKLTWAEAAAVARDGLLDMEARRTALAAREAVETVVAGPRKVFTTSSLTAGPAESDGTTGLTGALKAAIEAAAQTLFNGANEAKRDWWNEGSLTVETKQSWRRVAERVVRAAAPLIEREALERPADALRRADTSGWPGGRGSEVEGCRDAAVRVIERLAASLVVTGEGEW